MDFLDVEIPGHVYDDISRWQVADKNFEVVNQDSEGKRSKEKEYNDEIKWLNKNLGLETADTLLLPQGIKEVFESRFSTFLKIKTNEIKVTNKNTKVVAQSLIKYFITLKEFSQKLDAFHNSENIN